MRVLITTWLTVPAMGGVELHVDQLARRLAARGLEVTVLATDPSGTLPKRETADGVSIRRVRSWPKRRDYYFAPQIYTEIAKSDVDVVHVQAYHSFVGPIAMLAAWRCDLPYVLTFHAGGHSSSFRNAIRPLQLSLLRPLLARADRLIALAPFEIDYYSRRLNVPRTRFALIPNGSDLPEPSGEVRRDDALVASVGRLEQHKGHHRVIAVLPHILRQRPDVRLWIGGSGPYEPALKRLAKELGISDRVDIHAVPIQDRAQMANELARVKVVISLSELETQPIAALEAAALGCRLVVADVPGLRALAEAGLARAVPLATSPEETASVVLEELELPPTDARHQLQTWDECADAHVELYRDVARTHTGSGSRSLPA